MNQKKIDPSLFGIKHSNRDFHKADTWGKNQFNSSFPAALVAYMFSKNIDCVYIKTDSSNNTLHQTINGESLFGISPLSDDTFYSFESVYTPFQPFFLGTTPRIDLVLQNKRTGNCLRGLEIKLTALPDNSTCNLKEELFSSELVIRPDTISYLACSIAHNYVNKKDHLCTLLKEVEAIDLEDERAVIKNYTKLVMVAKRLIIENSPFQIPLVLQPVWKTKGKSSILAENCLDSFVWSNLALIHLFTDFSPVLITRIGRRERSLVWLLKMLLDFSKRGQFNADDIIDRYSYNTKNDKAFSVNGSVTYPYLKSKELLNPRVKKTEIKNIIKGGGQTLLSPERRFDAIICNSPDLFL